MDSGCNLSHAATARLSRLPYLPVGSLAYFECSAGDENELQVRIQSAVSKRGGKISQSILRGFDVSGNPYHLVRVEVVKQAPPAKGRGRQQKARHYLVSWGEVVSASTPQEAANVAKVNYFTDAAEPVKVTVHGRRDRVYWFE